MNNPYQENIENALEKYGRDIVAAVKDGKTDPVIGRDEEIRNVTRILSRKTKNNPVLIGEPGVGKTAIIRRYYEGKFSEILESTYNASFIEKTVQIEKKKISFGIMGHSGARSLSFFN